MFKVVQTKQSNKDLHEIWLYIAQDNKIAASTQVRKITAKFSELEQFPQIGRIRAEIGLNYRSIPIDNYVIFYRFNGEIVQIMRVLHSARDISKISF
jgi:toxin ParE1/3/4